LKQPLVALTGWGQDADRERALSAGFDHHLVKPVSIPTLVSLLQSLQP
jgi:CheY-like chemotaxis protein